MSSYFNSVDPTDADDEVISNLANAFAKIVSNHSSLKAQKININADLLITFEDLEDLTGNLKRMLKKEKDVNPELKFTKNVRLLKTRINQLSISFTVPYYFFDRLK